MTVLPDLLYFFSECRLIGAPPGDGGYEERNTWKTRWLSISSARTTGEGVQRKSVPLLNRVLLKEPSCIVRDGSFAWLFWYEAKNFFHWPDEAD